MKHTFQFLQNLKKNNNREWFESNRSDYEESLQEIKDLKTEIETEIMRFDDLETAGSKVFRIYRDMRFNKDREPYKTGWSLSFKRSGSDHRGGYYVHVEPGNTIMAIGFWAPEPKDLLHIRNQISQDSSRLEEIISDKKFISYFGKIQGDQVKTTPKGFEKNDPAIGLIKHKQFILHHSFTDEETLSKDFPNLVASGYQIANPFLTCMTEYLTTDLNGVPLS